MNMKQLFSLISFCSLTTLAVDPQQQQSRVEIAARKTLEPVGEYFFQGASFKPVSGFITMAGGALMALGLTNNFLAKRTESVCGTYFMVRNAPGLLIGASQAATNASVDDCLYKGIPVAFIFSFLADEKFTADHGGRVNMPTRVLYTLGSYAAGYGIGKATRSAAIIGARALRQAKKYAQQLKERVDEEGLQQAIYSCWKLREVMHPEEAGA